MKGVTVGLASGLGNCCFMLPAVKALYQAGFKVILYVETDFPTIALWRRCAYARQVIEGPAGVRGPLLAGFWRPASWKGQEVRQFGLGPPPYRVSEADNNLQILGVVGIPARRLAELDVSDWCRNLDRTKIWDVGIVPGSKGGVWERKRYPGMAIVADALLGIGYRVAVFGLPSDGADVIPGEWVQASIESLPDKLAGCRVIIGTDSGPTHLASSLGIPTVVVYTATSEIKGDPVGPVWRKLTAQLPCRPCQATSRWYGCHDWRCRQIDPAEVVRAAEELLCESLK